MPEKANNDPMVKPGIMSDGFIADVLEKEHVADSVKFGLQNGHDVYREILAEAARRLRRYSGDLGADDQFAPHYEPDVAKTVSGDAADSRELRNALRELLSQDVCVQHGFDGDSPYCKDCGGRPPEHGGAGTCPWEIARAALSKPPRNCDVGTAKEQIRRFNEFCDSLDCRECPVYELTGNGGMEECALVWAQMAYEKQEDK